MLSARIKELIKCAAVYGMLADEAREDGKQEKADKYDSVFEKYADHLGDETLEHIRRRKAELAR